MKTAEAMNFARLNRSDWENCLQRGLFPNAPKTEMGYVRLFDVDELVSAYVLGQLFERKVLAGHVCQIAVDVLDQVRKSPALKTLSAWKIAKPGGRLPAQKDVFCARC